MARVSRAANRTESISRHSASASTSRPSAINAAARVVWRRRRIPTANEAPNTTAAVAPQAAPNTAAQNAVPTPASAPEYTSASAVSMRYRDGERTCPFSST